jgi:cupin fold WbuC family metalloprotein
MLNAFEPYSYVQPHKHENPDKREVFIALRGRFAVFEFDCSGAITDHLVLDPQNGSYAAEIPAGIFHTIMALDPGAVAYEVKDGPFFPENDKNFAAWAPKEGSSGVEAYLRELLTKTEIH